ncbi:MAG: HlyD family efflux transporter periplasmic adaptor subunit [Rubripirellula sp.]
MNPIPSQPLGDRRFKKALLLLVCTIGCVSVAAGWLVRQSTESVESGSSSNDLSADLATSRSRALPVNIVIAGEVRPERLDRSFAGLLIARRESPLSFDRAGRVVEVSKEEGDRVRKGQTLATLAVDDLDASQDRVEAELAAAEARLDEFVAGPRKKTIQAAEARVEQLVARLGLAKANSERELQLAARDAGSRRELDEARFGLQAVSQELNVARAELALLVEGTRSEQVAAQKAVCDSIRSRLREIESDRRDSRIESPYDGVIRTRMIDEGAVVSSGETILHLISDQIEGRFGIPAALADDVAIGDNVEISLRTSRRTGAVARMEPSVDLATRTRAIYVEFDSNSESIGDSVRKWIPGEVAEVHLKAAPNHQSSMERSNDSFWLPTTAMARGGRGIWTVLVMPGQAPEVECERRAVELLKTEGAYCLVQGMLSVGDRVIVDGGHRVTAKMRVSSDSSPLSSESVE